MWKIAALSTFALLVVLADPNGGASAQTPSPTAQPPAAAPAAATPEKAAAPRKRAVRHAAHHKWRRHASFKCFGSEWRAFPTRDPNGYFYAPGRGGIC
jgi:hypothetical protein